MGALLIPERLRHRDHTWPQALLLAGRIDRAHVAELGNELSNEEGWTRRGVPSGEASSSA